MKRLYTLFALLLTLNSWLHITHAQDESTWMPDANLRTAVRNALGLANDDTLTQEVMTNLTELIAGKSDIANITGLEHATNLTDLQLTFNSIPDISPLRNLTNLTRLLLSNNPIGDITDLGNLTNLEILSVKNCGITDVSPLQTLVNLTTLRIAGNNLTNAHLLSTLTNLKDIDIKIPDPPLVANDIDITPPDPPPPPDVDPPGVSLIIPSGVQNGAFSVKIRFTESVLGFTESDLSLSGTATATASLTEWSITEENTNDTADTITYNIANPTPTTYIAIITPTTSGTVTLNVAANVATDAANNPNTAATSQTVTVDVDRPTVTISVPAETQTGAFDVTITFSETVSGFDRSDVALTGSAASITGWRANSDNTVYTATITPTASGTVTVNVAANAATDAANNPNTAATAQTVNVSLNADAPSVSISVPSGVQNSAFDATITFTEAVSGFVQSELSLGGTASASLTAWSANADNAVYTATITPTSSGTVILNIAANVATDAANNPNTAATSQTVTVDVDRPTVTIGVPSDAQTGAFDATITFSETVSGFDRSDVALTGSAASITGWRANSDNTVYTATITPTASGTVTINVAANVATDAANNPNTAATAQTVNVSLNADAPSVSISVPSGVQNSAFDATITFTEAVSGFVQSELSLGGTASASLTAWSANADDTVYTATITPTSSGTVILNIAANVATDAANNPNTAATSQTVTVDVDRPTVTIGVPSGAQTGAFDATITFSETVSGFDRSDVSLTGSAANITGWRANSDNTVYTATITPTASGTVTINVAANVATDAANNPNTAATAQTVTVSLDTEAPSVSISVPSGVQNSAFDATITFSKTVSGFEQNDLVITGTADAIITAWKKKETGKTVYTAEITPQSSGIVKLSVLAGVATDAARNPNTPSAAQQVEIDMTPPGISFSADLETLFITPLHYTTNGPFEMKITFTEPVRGFEKSDIKVGGGDGGSVTDLTKVNDENYIATVDPVIPPGKSDIYLHILPGVLTDVAGNPNVRTYSPDITIEQLRSKVVISIPNSDVTKETFTIEIKFGSGYSYDHPDDRPLGFEQLDVSLTNNTAGATITKWTEKQKNFNHSITGPFQSGYGVFEAEITATQSGTVTFGVPENVATDLAGNGNTAAVQKTVTITLPGSDPPKTPTDTTRPDVSFSFDLEEQFVTPISYITNGPFVMTIIFTEPVSGFEQSDLEVDEDWTYTDFKAIDPETIDAVVYADTYTVKVIPNPNDDSLYIRIHIEANVATDAAGNPNTSANSPRIRVEKFRPNVAITVPDSDVTTTTFTIEIKFDGGDARDDRPLGFEQTDLSLTNNTTGTTITKWTEKQKNFHSRTHGSFQGGYGAFEAEITATQSGTVTFGVPENVATDLAGNGNTAAVQKTVTIALPGSDPPATSDPDTTPPSVSFSFDLEEQFTEPISYITNGPFIMTIIFTEPVSGFEQSDLEVDEDWTYTDFKAIDPETIDSVAYADTYTVKVIPNPNGDSLYIRIHIEAGVATDAAGNPNTSANSPRIRVEKFRPNVAISVPDSDVTTETFTIEIKFDGGNDRDDRPLGFEQSDLSLTNNTAGATITRWTEKQRLYLGLDDFFKGGYGAFEAEITATQSGTVTFGVPENVATDLAGNGNTAAVQKTVTVTLADNQGEAPEAQLDLARAKLATMRPDKTRLLTNYPNPFNPETWIPYHLANPSNVSIIIYNMRGNVIRRLELGHQQAGYYTSRSRAAHWDGTNNIGERVATGIYFYQLQADNASLLRKMVILK